VYISCTLLQKTIIGWWGSKLDLLTQVAFLQEQFTAEDEEESNSWSEHELGDSLLHIITLLAIFIF